MASFAMATWIGVMEENILEIWRMRDGGIERMWVGEGYLH